MASTRSEDAWLFNGPNPSMASEKMFDHITEQNNPTPRIAHLAVSPTPAIPTASSRMMIPLKTASIRCGLDSPRKKPARSTSSSAP